LAGKFMKFTSVLAPFLFYSPPLPYKIHLLSTLKKTPVKEKESPMKIQLCLKEYPKIKRPLKKNSFTASSSKNKYRSLPKK